MSKGLFLELAANKRDKLTPEELALVEEVKDSDDEEDEQSLNPVSPESISNESI